MAWKIRTCFLLLLCVVFTALVLLGRWSVTSSVGNSRKTVRLKTERHREEKENRPRESGSVLPETKQTQQTKQSKLTTIVPGHYRIIKATKAWSAPYYTDVNKNLLRNRSGSTRNSFIAHTLKSYPEDDGHTGRIENLRRMCKNRDLFKNERKKSHISDIYYSTNHSFAYCKVPKSGSTFWMELFLVLKLGRGFSSYLLNHSRTEIHEKTKRLMTGPMKIVQSRSRMVIVSRNPFSRLHSAYIDKVYLPLFWDQLGRVEGATVLPPYYVNGTRTVLKRTKKPISERLLKFKEIWLKRGLIEVINISVEVKPICCNNASFEQFLKFIIAEVEAGRFLEAHWAPISHMCRPCMFNTFRIVKQESFNEDVLNVLDTFDVDISLYKSLEDSLNEDNRARLSAPAIIKVVDNKARKKNVNLCLKQSEMIKRLWKAFQIQGFISDDVKMPDDLLLDKFNRSKVTNRVLEAIAAKPLSKEQRTSQRRRHLVEAYRDVSPETKEKIRQIYKLDFALFDYSFDHPS